SDSEEIAGDQPARAAGGRIVSTEAASGSRDEMPLVLVIDDDDAILASFNRLLQSAGFQVLLANDGARGIALAEETHPHVILLDVQMPGMDGFDVCRHLKSQMACADTPVVFITGAEASPASIGAAFDVGADDFLLKPVNRTHLLARIRVILRQYA